MKKLLIIFGLSLLGIISGKAKEKFTVIGEKCLGTGISPNGKYVTGVGSQYLAYGAYMQSYLYDTETEKLEWITAYDETDYGKSGSFTDVSDEGVISGSFKDPDNTITVRDFDGDRTFPINVAAIWKNGKRTSLGLGTFKLSDFNYFEDGSFAEAISGNGKTVAGHIGIGNSAYRFPCMWKQTDKGDWTFSRLALPEDAVGGKASDVSGDGNIIVGTIWYREYEAAAYWLNGECHLIKGTGDDVQYNEGNNRNGAAAVSPNGKYIAFYFNRKNPAIYDLEKHSYVKLETFGGNSLSRLAISDKGNIVSSYSYGNIMLGKVYQRPFWFSYQDNRIFGFDYFMSLFAPGIVPPFSFLYEEKTQAIPCAVSADGTVILGNNNTVMSLGGVPENWVLSTNEQISALPEALDHVQVKSLNLKEVTISWEKEKHTYEGLELQSYTIYCEGQKLVDIPDQGDETFTYVHTNATPGYPQYSVASVFKNRTTGKLFEAPKSEPLTVTVPDTYVLPLYDDFDSGSLETNYWTKIVQKGDKIMGNWAPMVYSGIVDKGLYSSTYSLVPYSSSLISRPMDATGKANVWVSFVIAYQLLNSDNQPLEGDSLSIDVSVDKGNNWEEVKTYTLSQLSRNWNFIKIDLSSKVGGKLFQVRLSKHGEGMAEFTYFIDLFKVGTAPEKEAPEGLAGASDQQNVNLIWKNAYQAYQLNYQTGESSLAIGDEGNPFIAVNAFDAKDMEMYKGKYLTSVRAYVNHDFNIENSEETHASVVVFEDGKLIREQEIESIDYNEDNIVILKEPVAIDATKELKIGLKIFDYDARQIPITYQNTVDFIAGKSDLYSQDNGKTWQKLSNFFAGIKGKEEDGYCSWRISGDVTDEQTVVSGIAPDKDLYGYNLYRNGEQLNEGVIYYQQPHFIDNKPLDQATYEVLAFYLDGSVSEISNALVYSKADNINNERSDDLLIIYPNPATDYAKIDGIFDQVTLLDVNGQTRIITTENILNVSDLPAGIYILKIETGKKVEIRKLVVKR